MIVVDASILIALLDERDAHHESAEELFRNTPGPYFVHALTMAEVLVGPARLSKHEEVITALMELGVVVHNSMLDMLDSLRLAEIRARHGLKMPDACVLALAIHQGMKLATFDSKLAARANELDLLHA